MLKLIIKLFRIIILINILITMNTKSRHICEHNLLSIFNKFLTVLSFLGDTILVFRGHYNKSVWVSIIHSYTSNKYFSVILSF